MKKRIISIIIGCLFAFSTTVFAAEVNNSADSTSVPITSVYTIDQLFHDLDSELNFGSEEESGLFLLFAQERLAEAGEMTEAEKAVFLQKLVNDYTNILEQVQEEILETADEQLEEVPQESTEDPAEAEQESTEEEDDTAESEESSTENPEDEDKEDEQDKEEEDDESEDDLEEKIEKVNYTAKVVKDIDIETVKLLREKGLGFGQIAQVAVLAQISEKSPEEIADLFTGEDIGLGSVAKQLGIHPSEIKKMAEANKATKSKDIKKSKSVEKLIETMRLKMDEVIREKKQLIENKEAGKAKKEKEEKKLIENKPAKDEHKEKEEKPSKAEKTNNQGNNGKGKK